ncbi:hypothetical protein GQ457_01G017480 [Hibiscus cannabinus]
MYDYNYLMIGLWAYSNIKELGFSDISAEGVMAKVDPDLHRRRKRMIHQKLAGAGLGGGGGIKCDVC